MPTPLPNLHGISLGPRPELGNIFVRSVGKTTRGVYDWRARVGWVGLIRSLSCLAAHVTAHNACLGVNVVARHGAEGGKTPTATAPQLSAQTIMDSAVKHTTYLRLCSLSLQNIQQELMHTVGAV